MNYKIFILFLTILLVGSVSAIDYCYQEHANVSTACGGLDTGVYFSWSGPEGYDGNWATNFETGIAEGHVNYTIPDGANVNTSLWQVKTGDTPDIYNVTIGNNCFIGNSVLTLNMDFTGTGLNLTCLKSDGTNHFLYLYSGSSWGRIYEEAMFWDTADTVPNLNVSLNVPANASSISINSTTLNSSFVCTNCNLTNATFYVWNSSGYLYNLSSTIDINGTSNETTYAITGLNVDNYNWNVYACGINVTATICNWSSKGNFIFNIGASINNETYTNYVFETASELFVINITSPIGYTPTNASLVYNGTEYSATIVNIVGQNYSISRTIDIETVTTASENKTFHWKWNFGSSTQTTNDNPQEVNITTLAACNLTYNVSYMNFTFKDEATNAEMNVSIDSASWTYWLGSGTSNKTFSYSNSSSSQSYAFCYTPADKTLNTDLVLKYSNTSYPIRTYSSYNKALTNTTTNQLLYLLSSTTGQYVSFQIIDNTGTVIQGVFVNVTRSIGGVTVGIEQGLTGSDGTITFWLNPSFPHTIIASKSGFDTYTTSITPSQTTYTISLGTSISTQITDYLRGIIYKIRPRLGTVLLPNTIYNFNLTLSSTYWTLSSFGFNLIDNGTIVGSNSSTSNGGIVTLLLNTSNYTHIKMHYYWITNGTTTNATSGGWLIYNYTAGGNWSLSALFGDIKTYSNQEIFGLDTDALNLIIFILIFVSVGVMSYKFGFSSPAVISGMVFALVFLFDVGLGMINIIGAIPHFPTIIIGIIMIGFIIKEAT